MGREEKEIMATALGGFSTAKTENKAANPGVGKDSELSFVNIEFEMPETFNPSHLVVT